jgi:iron complex outermembrane receptor protein
MRINKPLAAAITLSLFGTGTYAQTGVLEEVIVTATKRAESLQDIAVTVTAFSADTIQEAGINNASDIAILTPSLNINANTSPFRTRMTIRGIGTAGFTYLEPSVGVFVDGVYLNRSGLGVSDLVDIERIEVLQGPQGTLYGKNTNAGAISITTKRPNLEEPEGHLEAQAGDYSMYRLNGSASLPLTDTMAFRLAGNYHERDGYLDNKAGDDLNDADEWSLVGKLLWEPSDTLSILLKASHVERDMNCCSPDTTQDPLVDATATARGLPVVDQDPFDYETAQSVPSTFELDANAASLHIDYDHSWGTITSITSWDDYDVETFQEASRSVLSTVFLDEPQDGDSFSQELRFSSSTDNIDYMGGLYYFEQTTNDGDGSAGGWLGADTVPIGSQILGPQLAVLAAEGDTTYQKLKFETETVAVFGRATWHMGDRWNLTGGLRWSDESKDADLFVHTESTALTARDPEDIPPPILALLQAQGINPPISFLSSAKPDIDSDFDRSSDNVDWLLSASYDLGDSTMVFASASTGTKSGGFNGVNGGPDEREFDDEDTTSYELGIKTTLLDSRLRINSTLFLTQIDEFQAAQQAASGLGRITTNQGEVEVAGLDLQVDAVPLPNLTLSAGLQYLDKYEFTDGPDDGLEVPWAAEWSGNLAATLMFPLADGGLYLRGDYSFMGDHWTNSASAAQLESKDEQDRETVNAKLGWRNDNWDISVWGKNLTDDEYAAQTLTPYPVTDMDAYFLAPPRTYGATLRYDF